MYFEKGMNLPFGEILKKEMDVPILIAGRMENPDLASEALRDGKTDLIALGRSLLADPDTVNKIRSGRFEFVRPCLGCHELYEPAYHRQTCFLRSEPFLRKRDIL